MYYSNLFKSKSIKNNMRFYIYFLYMIPINGILLPHRNVNLDLPANERWNDIVEEFAEPLKYTLNWVNDKSKLFEPIIYELKQELKNGGGWDSEYINEMKGISNYLNISYDIIETANLFFEWDPGCTSIVAQMNNGNIIHGRNFDLGVGHTTIAPISDSLISFVNLNLSTTFRKSGSLETDTFLVYIALPLAIKDSVLELADMI